MAIQKYEVPDVRVVRHPVDEVELRDRGAAPAPLAGI
jgi:hypothetical protein